MKLLGSDCLNEPGESRRRYCSGNEQSGIGELESASLRSVLGLLSVIFMMAVFRAPLLHVFLVCKRPTNRQMSGDFEQSMPL